MRTLLAGAAGGLAMNLAILLTFRLIGFGWNEESEAVTMCYVAIAFQVDNYTDVWY
jgi:hypothetical protein